MPIMSRDLLVLQTSKLLIAVGMDEEKAQDVAEILVEGDLIGHRTHGVSMLRSYIAAVERGEMKGSGNYNVLNDFGSCLTLDGGMLPGAWLVRRSLDLAFDRIEKHGIVTVAIARSHHIGALAAYLSAATDRGLVAQIKCSTASVGRMAPFGGTTPILTPNPSALGLPSEGDPIIIDISASIATTTLTQALAAAGQRYPETWALTSAGEPTDDPIEVTQRRGTLLPLGGVHKGHKGYGMALGVDILTQGLSGFGRADFPGPMSLAVMIQVIDPRAFSGLAAFTRQSSFTADLCRNSRPAKANTPVRVPGDAASKSRRRGLEQGIDIPSEVFEALAAEALRLGVEWPAPEGITTL